MDPINYNIDVANPVQSTLAGYQTGLAFNAQQQQQKLQQQQQQDMLNLSRNPNPTAQDYANVMLRNPAMADHVKKVWDVMEPGQKEAKISQIAPIFSAINNGNIDVAKTLAQQQVDALKNSGRAQEAAPIEAMIQTLDVNPKVASDSLGMTLSQAMGPEKFAALMNSRSTASKSAAETRKLSIEAEQLPEKLALEQEKLGEDIESTKLKRQLDVLDAQIRSADSETKRGQLQIERDKLVGAAEEAKAAKAETTQAAVRTIQEGKDNLDALLNHPFLKDSTDGFNAAGMGTWLGKSLTMWPGTNAKDFVEQLKSMDSKQMIAAMQELRKGSQSGATGMGSLTEKEGEMLKAMWGSLNPDMSPKQFIKTATRIKDMYNQAERRAVASGSLAAEKSPVGNTYVMAHPKYGTVTEAVINDVLTKNPGMSRQQVVDFLKQSGGK